MGYKVGLDYNAVYAIANTLLIDVTMSVLAKLQALEAEEINCCIQKAKKEVT